MCIHYTVEFWTPQENPSADAERRVLRGIAQPGQNRDAKHKEFWDHDGQILARPTCSNPREGGFYFNRIFEFCFDDVSCGGRLDHFESEYERCRRACEDAERSRESKERQNRLAQNWLDAYHDWVSAYESHKDCPKTRNNHTHFNMLRQAGVCVGMYGLPDKIRIGISPHSVTMPPGPRR